MKNAFHLLLLIFIVFCYVGCDQEPVISPSGKAIKVGIIAPFTGPKQNKGKEGLAGIKTARQLQPLLQNGDRIELILEDDRNNPDLSLKSLQKLVEKEKVSAIITFSDSEPVLAMAKIADTYKTPILALTATNPDITEQNHYISQLCFDDNFQGTVAAIFVRDELLIDKVAVFRNPNRVYSMYLASIFEQKFRSIGGVITDHINLTDKTDDLAKIVKSVHDKAPELLYLPIKAKEVLLVSEECRKLFWKPKMMGSDGLLSYIKAQYGNKLHRLEGLLATDFFVIGMPLSPLGKRARREHGVETSTFSALGTEGYAILLDALNRCSDPENRECVNHQIRSTTDFTGLAGKISIGPDGKARRPLFIESVQAGQPKFMLKVY